MTGSTSVPIFASISAFIAEIWGGGHNGPPPPMDSSPPYIPMGLGLKLFKIYDINTLQIATFMFKYNNDMLPPVFTNLFSYNSNFHSYPTRTCNDMHLNNPKLLLAQKALRHHGPDIWNTLPNSLKDITSLTSFKKSLKQMLSSQYIP